MKQNKFTIIIPTRERADTLYWCLKTLVAQDYENLEILVSDNFSQDNTKEVVDSLDDKRIRYINTGKRVEMSLNWEFALSHVTEGYVGFLGDDDGYLPHTIEFLNYLLNQHEEDAVVWRAASYNWIDSVVETATPWFTMPITTNILELRNAEEWYKKFEQLNVSIQQLICIYNCSVVSIKIINKIKSYYNQTFFRSSMPDLFSSCILTKYAKNYIYIDKVLSIGGTSRKSNSGLDDKVLALFHSERTLPVINKYLGNEIIYSWVVFNADAIFYAEENDKYEVDSKTVEKVIDRVIEKIIFEIKFYPIERYLHTIKQIDKLLEKYPHKKKKWENIVQKNHNSYSLPALATNGGISNNMIQINARDLGVMNIYEATSFCYLIFYGTNSKTDIINTIKTPKYVFLYKKLSKLKYYLGRIIEKCII